MPAPQTKPQTTPPEPVVAPTPPAEPAPQTKPQKVVTRADCEGVSAALRSYVDQTYGKQCVVLALGKTEMIVWDGDPKKAGVRYKLPK